MRINKLDVQTWKLIMFFWLIGTKRKNSHLSLKHTDDILTSNSANIYINVLHLEKHIYRPYHSQNNYHFFILWESFRHCRRVFMLETLKALNFGPHFIKWIQRLYNNLKFRVKNNGFISKTNDMTRGIRQGCPLSA